MKTKQKKGSASVLIVLIVAIVLIVSVTFAAIFRETLQIDRLFTVSNFSAQTIVTFVKNNTVVADGSDYDDEYGFLVSLDPHDDNYLGYLRAKVQYKGAGVGLIRVRVVEEWSSPIYETIQQQKVQTGRVVQPYQLKMPYTVSPLYNTASGGDSGNKSKWFDNRDQDHCYYYATPVSSAGTSEIPLITGVDTSNLDLGVLPEGTQVHILIETDAVQVNRYPQYWNMNALPWNGVNSGIAESWTEVELETVTEAAQTP